VKKILRLGHIKLGEITDSASGCPVVGIDLVDLVIFWIEEQSHRASKFGNQHLYDCPIPNIAFAAEGVVLASRRRPEMTCDSELDTILYVRGYEFAHDDDKMLCTLEEWPKIEIAVRKYNETDF
jgi:hypothetical protein